MYSWGDNRPYNSFANRIREKYGSRLQKVSVNAGFTCPNRDGYLALGGCTYCNNASFTPSYCNEKESIESVPEAKATPDQVPTTDSGFIGKEQDQDRLTG